MISKRIPIILVILSLYLSFNISFSEIGDTYMIQDKNYVFHNNTNSSKSFTVGIDWAASNFGTADNLAYQKIGTHLTINVKADYLRINSDGSNGNAVANEYITYLKPTRITLSAGEKIIINPKSDLVYDGLEDGISFVQTSIAPIKRIYLILGKTYVFKNDSPETKMIYFSGEESPNIIGNVTIEDKNQMIIKQIKDDYLWFTKNVGIAMNEGYKITIQPNKEYGLDNRGYVTAYMANNAAGIINEKSEMNLDTSVVSVYVNGNKIEFDQPPVIKDGRTLVPVRAIAEALGSNVSWNELTQTVVIQRGLDTAVFQIGNNKAYSKKIIVMDVGAQVINGRTLIPVKYITEIFGGKVEWDPITKSVHISCEELTNKMIIDDFYKYGFYWFNYYDVFSENLNKYDYAFKKVLGEIGNFGNMILMGVIENIGNISEPKDLLKNYDIELVKRNLVLMLNNMPKTDGYKADKIPDSVSASFEGVSNFNDALLIANENLDKFSASQQTGLKLFSEAFDNMASGVKVTNYGAELIEFMFNDYMNQIDYLFILEKSLDTNNPIIRDALKELRIEYTFKYLAGFYNFMEKISGELLDVGAEKILNTFGSVGSAYNIATFAIESINSLTGSTQYANDVESAVSLMLLNYDLMNSYDITKSKYCSINGEISATKNEWDEFVVIFKLTKAGVIEAYKCMESVSTSTIEKIYLKSQIDVLENININSSVVPSNKDQVFEYISR